MNIFRGYVTSDGKRATMKYKDVPSNELLTIEQVKNLPHYCGIISEEYVLVDLDNQDEANLLFQIIKEKEIKCQVRQTTHGMHFYFKNNGITTNKIHQRVAIGLTVDYKAGNKACYATLKKDGIEREVIYDCEEYDDIPKWLFPVNSKIDFVGLNSGEGRNQKLFSYILTLQGYGFIKDEIKETLSIINNYILKNPLPQKELETIMRDGAFEVPVFFNKETFLFDKFATYIKETNHIIRINNQLHVYRDGIYVNSSKFIEAQMIKLIPRLSKAKRAEVLAYLDVLICENTPLSDANYIAFKNGIYNIAENTLEPFSPDIVIVNKINYNYNPYVYSEITDKTLNKISCQDESVRQLLEEVIGYCFYRRNELRKAFVLLGDRANGKSTYLDMIKTMLGDENTVSLDLKELNQPFKTAELFGKLANIGDDISDEFIPDAGVFKKLISGDPINARRLYGEPFDFNCYAKFLFSANDMPRIKDRTEAVLSRLIIVPFQATFSKSDPDFDPYIKYKLRKEESIEYLIMLGIEGLKRVLSNQSFSNSKKVDEEIVNYQQTNNPVLQFFNECEEDGYVFENMGVNDVYIKYDLFCNENGLQPLSKIEFGKQIRKKYNLTAATKRIDGKNIRVYLK